MPKIGICGAKLHSSLRLHGAALLATCIMIVLSLGLFFDPEDGVDIFL
jgi:hypothetical protein